MQLRSAVAVSLVLAAACGNVMPPLADGPADPSGDGAPAVDAVLADAGREGASCDDPGGCESGVCADGACVEHLSVPCTDTAPPNATSVVIDVPIEFVDGAWTSPAACAWDCNVGYCASGPACAVNATDVGYSATGGSRWFGGDDRDLDGDGEIDIRSVGAGQSFAISTNTTVVAVGLRFEGAFRSVTTGDPHATNVAVELRSSSGAVLAGTAGVVPETFTGGWVDWGLAVDLAPGTYVLTAYVPGVFTGENYTSGIRTDFAGGYAGGTAYFKEITGGGTMPSWSGWSADASSEHAFRVISACP